MKQVTSNKKKAIRQSDESFIASQLGEALSEVLPVTLDDVDEKITNKVTNIDTAIRSRKTKKN